MRNTSFLLSCLLVALAAFAQNDQRRDFVLTSYSDLVLVPVTVTNKEGGIVNGLTQSQFQIKENKIDQRIFSVSEQDVPASIGIVLDTSGSMNEELPAAKTALKEFLADANPDDEAFLYTVSANPRRESFFTTDFDAMLGRVSFRSAFGSTALIDTIYAGLDGLREAKHARRALLIISDGMDNHSRYSKAELMSLALESNAQIYAISIHDPSAYQKPAQLKEERAGLALLDELAWKTGGIPFVVRNTGGLHAATAQIGRALRNQYVLSYVPRPRKRDGKWQSIHVTVAAPHAMVYARPGYRAD
ncbi:MAG TPA: VWA domain-containing protein [Bryobacteraceae bacterium]|jgi:Ca-activated chloride channel family protein